MAEFFDTRYTPANAALATLLQYQDLEKQQQETKRLGTDVQLTQAQTQALQQRSAMEQQAMQRQNAYFDALRGQQINGSPLTNNPNTSSIAATEAQSPTDVNQKILNDLQQDKQRILQNIQMAQQFGVDPKEWVTALSSVNTQIRESGAAVAKRQSENSQQAAQVLRDVDSPEALSQAVSYIGQTFGQGAAFTIDKSLPKDQQGNYLWNEQAKRTIAPYVSQYTTMHEKATQQNNAATLQERWATLLERQQYHTSELAARETDQALRREGMDRADRRTEFVQGKTDARAAASQALRKRSLDLAEEGMGFREDRQATTVEMRTNQQLASDPVAKTMPLYEKAFNSAKNVIDNLNNDSWLANRDVSEPAARSMMTDYRNMINNFKSTMQAGGKWTSQEESSYASLLEKMKNVVATIGQGKKPPPRVMQDVAGEIERMYREQNLMAVKKSLQARETAYNQGANPANVRMLGNLDRAANAPGVYRATDPQTGVEYLVTGKSKDDAYPIYTTPKPKPERKVRGAALLNSVLGEEEE